MSDNDLRDAIVERGRSLYDRGYAHGSSGNLSARLDDGILITPTGSSLGRLDPKRISRVDAQVAHGRCDRRAMALIAVGDQDGADFLLKKVVPRSAGIGSDGSFAARENQQRT